MSAAAARAPRRVDATRTGTGPSTSEAARPELRVLPAQPFRAPRGPFALVVGAVLTLGLLVVLALNTVVAQDAFAVSALQQRSAVLADREQALTQEVSAAESPQRLEQRAAALGMVPSVNPVFLRLSDGKVLGDPVAGKSVRRAAAPAAAAPATGTSARPTAPHVQSTTAAHAGATTTQHTPQAVRTKAAHVVRTKAAKAGG